MTLSALALQAGQITIFQAAQSISQCREKEVLEGAKDAVRSILSPKKFSLFLYWGGGMHVVINEGWDSNGNLTRWYPCESPLFQKIIKKGETLCVTNPQDEKILAGQGLFAGPIRYPDNGKIVGMLKIESMDFLDFNDEAADVFKVLCDWIGLALVQAHAYETISAERFHSSSPRLLSSSALDHQIEYMGALAERFGFSVSMITVNPLNTGALVQEERTLLADIFGKVVLENLRSTDVAFEYSRTGPSFVVILAGASEDIGHKIVKKLSYSFRKKLPVTMRDLEIKYYVKHLERGNGSPRRNSSTEPSKVR